MTEGKRFKCIKWNNYVTADKAAVWMTVSSSHAYPPRKMGKILLSLRVTSFRKTHDWSLSNGRLYMFNMRGYSKLNMIKLVCKFDFQVRASWDYLNAEKLKVSDYSVSL